MPQPAIDPTTGQPVNQPEGGVVIKQEEWDGIKTRLDAFERNAAQPVAVQPIAPVQPTGPTFDDQIREIDTEIVKLDTQVDIAVADGKPVSQLMRSRDDLNRKRTRLEIKHNDLDPALSAGIATIDQISAEVSRGKMPHYDIVKDDVETQLRALPAEQRMNPQVRQAAYNMAVGQNVNKILDAKKEEMLRSVTENQNLGDGGANSRSGGGGDATTPKPKDVLSKGALQAINSKGVSVNQYYKSLGYEGWDDFYDKKGKSHFGEGEEE